MLCFFALVLLVSICEASYCQPSEACWPSPAAWNAFNQSVDGQLIAVEPEGQPCYTDPSSEACQAVVGNWTNPYWRADQPGAMQGPNWEEGPNGEDCFTPDEPCEQGSVPTVAVAVLSPQHVALSIAFATQYNIQLVVKSSGHDFQGRSTAAGALMVWMHTYTGVSVNTHYTACAGDSSTPAVTVVGGTNWGTVYDSLPSTYNVVGGSARTVCACGGYVLGGGHSWTSPAYGLAVDNVLSFQAVLANGSIVTASPCSHPNLFWALRGGGGGSFAVITSVTYKLHAVPLAGVAGFVLAGSFLQGNDSLNGFLEQYLSFFPTFVSSKATGGVFGGYMFIYSNVAFELIYSYNGTQTGAKKVMQPFLSYLESNSDLFNITANVFFYEPSLNAWHNVIDQGDPTGSEYTIGSRLIPLSYCSDPVNRTATVNVLAELALITGELEFNLVAGGAVSAFDRDSSQTSVTPAWRDAAFHLTFAIPWNTTTSYTLQQEIFQAVTALTGLLRSTFPDSGAYWSESDYLEPDWQQSFWGSSNYARLQQIKAVYDPTGIFSCHHCVELPVAK